MKITIITAAWQLAGLKNTIKCIDNQTHPACHIIVNDSNPEIEEWLYQNNYFNEHPSRIVISLHQRLHWFGCYARNIGVMAAFTYIKERHRERGKEFVVFMDDDNHFLPDYLALFAQGHEENPSATMIGIDMLRVGKKNPDNKKYIPCSPCSDMCDIGSFAYNIELFEKYGYFRARKEKKFKYDWELIKKIIDGEGMGKIQLVHTKNPSFLYAHKKY